MAEPTTVAELRNKPIPQGAVDPNVKIPKQILDAGLRSEAIQRSLAGDAEPSVAAQIEGADQQPTPPNAAPPTPDAAPTPPPQQPAQVEDEASWERKFKSLDGRLRAQSSQISDLSQRLEAAQRENQLLRSSAPAPQQQEQQPNGHSLITEQEIADYGPEFVDIMRRVAAETAGPLNEEIGRLRAQMGHVQQETGNAFLNRMNSTLNAAIPNWAELNKDPRFIEWSQLPDVFSGAIRKTLMQDAWNSGDPQRVAAFFQAYLAEEAATNPQGNAGQRIPSPSRMVVSDQPVDPRLSPPTSGGPLDLASLAAPGRAHSAGAAPAEKPVYTAAEITRFYTDVAAGRWRGREQQQAAIDADIILAQREGRIITDQRTTLPRDPYMR